MQTYAEIGLIKAVKHALKANPHTKIINIGSSGSLVVEKALEAAGCEFTVDHLDIEPRESVFSRLKNTYTESAEDMVSISDNTYQVAFSNFVFEHIQDTERALRETYRILNPGGTAVFTVPNPQAPEFFLIKQIPLKIRGILKGYEVWPTYYGYKSISRFKTLLQTTGFEAVEIQMHPAVFTYTYKYPILAQLGTFYDKILHKLKLDGLMGHAVILAKKTLR